MKKSDIGIIVISIKHVECFYFASVNADDKTDGNKVQRGKNSTMSKQPDSYWKSKLDPEVYRITRCQWH